MRQTLGVQGAVETLLAFDLQSSREVIVRTAPQTALPSATWMRLVHEAAVLETLEPLDLSRPIATGTDAGVVYLATEFVPGITLAQRLTRGPLTVHETLSIAASVLTALHATHERGILHRDLHPERLIVAAEGVIERATLVGFGFTRSLAHELSLRDLPASAALHVSPEQAGLIERGVDGRSDLYSVGAVMFECLTGQPLFAGTSLGEILRKHLTSPVPLLAGRVAGVPRVLDELLERLLRKDPRDRYQSAQAALADVIALDEALARGIAEPTLVVGLRDRRRSLAEPRFVGREAEVSSLEVELSRAAAGNGRLVVIEGPSGAGKSRLLDEFARVATRRGAFVLRGRASETEAQLAGNLLAGLSRSVVSELLERPALRQRLATALEGRTHALHSLFPELAQVLGESALPGGPELYGEQRTVEALAVLFGALGDRERPLVLMLDDFQWAPDRAVRLALEWARRAGNLRGQVFVSFVVATRADELGPHHPVRALSAEGVRLELPALTADEIRQLADSMAGPLPAEALLPVERLAAGNPFLAVAVVQGLVESNALVGGAEGWRVDASKLSFVQSSRQAAAVLARRLEQLSVPQLELLAVGAVLGRHFDAAFAAALAGMSVAEAMPLLRDAARRQLLGADASGGAFSFLHDRLRDAVLTRLSDAERRTLHAETARRMQAIDSSRVFELAQHFDAAGEPARALPYALAAAQQAKASGDVDVAERYYRIADRCSAGAPPEVRRELAEALGDVLTVRGLYAEAAVQLERARALIVGRAARARLALRVGDLCYRQGDFRGAGEALERGLAILGRPVWRARLPLLAGIGWQVLRLAARTLLPAPGPRRAITNTEEDLLACNMYSRLSLTAILARGALWSVWAHLQELNLAERHPDTPEQARAWSLHALAMAQLPWFGRAIDFAERAVQLCRKLGDSWHLGLALQRQAFVLSWSSRFDEALLKGREALTLLERAGDRWEAEAAMFCLASTLLRTGRLREAVELSRELRQSGLSSGNALASTYPLEVWARATFGKVPASDVASELDRRRDQPHLRPALAVADGVRLLYAGRVPEAVQALEEGEAQVRRSGLRSELVAPVRMWLATARRMLAMQDNPLDAQGREQRLAAAVRASRDALALARRFPNNAAHALRESGLCAALAGDGARARALFDESIATAERLGQRHERALTLEACADVGDALGWPGAAADRAQSRLERAALELPSADATSEPPTHTLSLIERFQTLLIEGRRIASALSHDAVFQATRAAAQSLLRAEPCAVLTLSPTGAVVVPSPLFPATELLAARAIAAEHPVIVALDDDPRGPGAPDAPKRSIIAAPIAIRGEVVALLCAAHPQLGATFGLDDERLAAFVTALAGAALENADGFARLQSAEHALRESDRQIRGLAEGAAREQEEERKRLALALHDGAGQALVAATLQLEDLRRRPEGLPLAPAIERVEALLRSLLEDLRAMSHDLRPAVLDHFGLQAALQKLADASSTTSLRVSLQLQHDDLPELRGDGALGLYRIAQAALANVARHAQATHAEMSLEITPAEVVLEIADDGLGFDPEARRASSGIGLLGIRERTAWLRGRFELTTAPGEGTSVRVTIPRPRLAH